MTRSLLTVGGLAGGAPVGTVGAGGPDVAPLVAAMAALARVDMQGDVGGDMLVSFSVAGVKVVAERLLKFVEVLFIFFFFLEALIGIEWERDDAPGDRVALQDARIEGGSGNASLEGIRESGISEI